MAAPHMPARPPTRRELRGFALSVGGAFVVLAVFAAWRGRAALATAFGTVGAALWLAGALAPARLAPVHRAWMRMALAISAVTTPILMGIVYFGVLTPLAFVTRVLRWRTFGVPRDAATAWVDRAPDARRSDLRRQF